MLKRMKWLAGAGMLWMAVGCGPIEPGEELAPSEQQQEASASAPDVTALGTQECLDACRQAYLRCLVICSAGPIYNPYCKPNCSAAYTQCTNSCSL